MATKRAKKEPSTEEIVEGLLQQDRVIYFPIKHFSPVSGLQVKRLIEAVRPVGGAGGGSGGRHGADPVDRA